MRSGVLSAAMKKYFLEMLHQANW